MERILELVVLLSALALIPALPAYFLYKNLPSKTSVAGPFKGLQIRLTGAFGAYFLIVLALSGVAASYLAMPTSYEPWVVRGRIAGISAGRSDDFTFSIQPPTYRIVGDGSFSIVVPVERSTGALPVIEIGRRGYEPQVVHLEADSLLGIRPAVTRSMFRRTIVMADPLRFKPAIAEYGSNNIGSATVTPAGNPR